MKTSISIVLLALCFGCGKPVRYDFHSSKDGQVIWRCDRISGDVQIFSNNVGNYEFYKGQFCDYLIEKRTGFAWRYYKNEDTNRYPNEGFKPLSYGCPIAENIVLAGLTNDRISKFVKPLLPTDDPSMETHTAIH